MPVDVLVETTIHRTPEVVSSYAGDPSNATEWYANIRSVSWKTPPPVAIGSRMEFAAHFLGRRLVYTYEIAELVPGKLLVMRPAVGWVNRVRLGRGYYVRVDSSDYSVDPAVIGRFVDVHADLASVEVRHEGRLVARHDRVWARQMTITDPTHVAAAKVLREQFQQPRPATQEHEGLVRDLADYDRAFGLTHELVDGLVDGLVDTVARDELADGEIA